MLRSEMTNKIFGSGVHVMIHTSTGVVTFEIFGQSHPTTSNTNHNCTVEETNQAEFTSVTKLQKNKQQTASTLCECNKSMILFE